MGDRLARLTSERREEVQIGKFQGLGGTFVLCHEKGIIYQKAE